MLLFNYVRLCRLFKSYCSYNAMTISVPAASYPNAPLCGIRTIKLCNFMHVFEMQMIVSLSQYHIYRHRILKIDFRRPKMRSTSFHTDSWICKYIRSTGVSTWGIGFIKMGQFGYIKSVMRYKNTCPRIPEISCKQHQFGIWMSHQKYPHSSGDLDRTLKSLFVPVRTS